jgi:hypothetical protein
MPRAFPPQASDTNWRKDGRLRQRVQHLWGECQVEVQVYEHKLSKKHCRLMRDASLDSSGYSPKTLDVLLSFVAQLPFEIADQVRVEAGSGRTGAGKRTLC